MDGTQFRNLIVSSGKVQVWGLYGDPQNSDKGGPQDSCEFVFITGANGVADVAFTAGVRVLIPASMVPKGCRIYITSTQVVPTTAFSGGTAGTVSMTLEGTDGVDIASYTQTALGTLGAYVSLPAATPPTGATDVGNGLALMGANTAKNVGLQVLMANSTAGVARLRIRGYFAP